MGKIRTRVLLGFAWFPTKTIDCGLCWLCPIIKTQKYRERECIMPDCKYDFTEHWWETIEKRRLL